MAADPNHPDGTSAPPVQPNTPAAAPPGNSLPPQPPAAPLTASGSVQVNIPPEEQKALLDRLTALISERAGPSAAFLRQVEGASLFVLILSALGIFLLLTFYRDTTTPSWQTERAVELLLTLAGTSIILALLSRNPNALTLVFGFLIIGALVVPSNDIIRFALLATGSDKTYRDFVSSNAPPTSARLDRTPDVAMRIYQSLRPNLTSDTVPDDVVKKVREVLVQERDIQSFESVRQRGALEVLIGLSGPEKDELIYRYGQDDRFREDVEFLRQEGLISYVYDDVTTIKVEPLGQKMAAGTTDGADADAARVAVAEATAPGADIVQLELGEEVSLAGTAERWYSFKAPASGSYYFIAVAQDVADPVLTLYLGNDIIAFGDDTGASLDAEISISLEEGKTYLLQVEDISFVENSGIILRVIPQPDSPQAAAGSNSGGSAAGQQDPDPAPVGPEDPAEVPATPQAAQEQAETPAPATAAAPAQPDRPPAAAADPGANPPQ